MVLRYQASTGGYKDLGMKEKVEFCGGVTSYLPPKIYHHMSWNEFILIS